MISTIRTDSSHADFIELVKALDAELATVDVDYESFYKQFSLIDTLKYVVVAYEDKTPVGCGAIKEYQPGIMEIKRMYTIPSRRDKGIGAVVLKELEEWTADLGMKECILETGTMQGAAMRLYEKSGYAVIPNYGQYEGQETSICYQKSV